MDKVNLARIGDESAQVILERLFGTFGLQIRSQSNLKSYPGCIHWHLERPGEPGTLELTDWPAQGALWVSVQAGRRAPWTDQILDQLRHEQA